MTQTGPGESGLCSGNISFWDRGAELIYKLCKKEKRFFQMAQSIFKFYRSKPTTMWFQLSEEEQARFAAQSGILLEKVGAKALVVCNAYWSNEEWPIFGVEEFPSMEALQEHSKLLTEGGWMRYFVSQTMLGTTWGE